MTFVNFLIKHSLIRYLLSGGIAAATNLGALYILTDFFGLYYIISGIISFLVALLVSFTLQKKWTFEDHTTHLTHQKFALFASVALLNLLANTLLLYTFAEIFRLHYLLAQILASGLVATWSFFVYKIVFNRSAGMVKLANETSHNHAEG
jgi:putative flippase GtrA